MAVFISGESLLASKVLPAPTPDFCEARHQCLLGRHRRAELQHEIQNVENCGEVFSSAGVSGLMKSTAGPALGAGWPRKRGERLHLVAGLDLLTLSISSG